MPNKSPSDAQNYQKTLIKPLQNLSKLWFRVNFDSKSSDSIVEPMENGPIVENGTSKLADSIVQLDVFEESGSKKGPKWLQPL